MLARRFLAGLGLAALVLSVPAARAADETLASRLDAVMERAIAEQRLVGAVVVVLNDGEVVYRRAAGEADREAGLPMREDAIFRLASVSKPLVTAAALALVDQGRLGLDDPVTKWLPDFRPQLPDGTTPVITVRQLLTHTAGLSYRFFQPADGPYHQAGVSDGLDISGLTLEEELRRIAAADLAYPPGTAWAYSLAIDVLGAVVAEAAGAPLPEAVARLVTQPLGLADTGFAVTDPARLAVPYADGDPAPVRMSDPYVLTTVSPSGLVFSPGRAFAGDEFPSGGAGMLGTADELARFLEAIRSGGGIVKAETARAMMTNQTGELPIVTNGPGWGWGLGGAVLVDPAAAGSPQSAGTWTWGGAYGHSWFVDPGRGLVVVGLTNTTAEGMMGAFVTQLHEAIYGTAQ